MASVQYAPVPVHSYDETDDQWPRLAAAVRTIALESFNEFDPEEPAEADLPGSDLDDFHRWRSTDPLSDWGDYPGPGWDRL
jgi:hypothetical protein